MTHINLTGPVFDLLRNAVAELDVRAFVIGGCVRDVILGRECKDIDIVVEGSGIDLAKKVASKLGKGVQVNIFKNFGTAMIHLEDIELEFVGARKNHTGIIHENRLLKTEQSKKTKSEEILRLMLWRLLFTVRATRL